MSESASGDPCPSRFANSPISGIPYRTYNLSPQRREQLNKAVREIGDQAVKVVVNAYFNIANSGQPSTEWSHVDTRQQPFVGKIDAVSYGQKVFFQLGDGDEHYAATSGLEVIGKDRHGNDWRMFAAFEDLLAVYPPVSPDNPID